MGAECQGALTLAAVLAACTRMWLLPEGAIIVKDRNDVPSLAVAEPPARALAVRAVSEACCRGSGWQRKDPALSN